MHEFWASIFRADRDTVIVTADSGFGTLQDVLGRRLSLADYTGLQLGNLSLHPLRSTLRMTWPPSAIRR